MTVFQLPDHGFARAVCGGAPQMFHSLTRSRRFNCLLPCTARSRGALDNIGCSERFLAFSLASTPTPLPSSRSSSRTWIPRVFWRLAIAPFGAEGYGQITREWLYPESNNLALSTIAVYKEDFEWSLVRNSSEKPLAASPSTRTVSTARKSVSNSPMAPCSLRV